MIINFIYDKLNSFHLISLVIFFLFKFVDYDHSSGKSKDIDWLGPKGLDLQGIKARGNLVLVFFNY